MTLFCRICLTGWGALLLAQAVSALVTLGRGQPGAEHHAGILVGAAAILLAVVGKAWARPLAWVAGWPRSLIYTILAVALAAWMAMGSIVLVALLYRIARLYFYPTTLDRLLWAYHWLLRGPALPGSHVSGAAWIVLPLVMVTVLMIYVGVTRELAGWRARQREREGCCKDCGYNLRGSPGANCPECGSAIPQEKSRTTAAPVKQVRG